MAYFHTRVLDNQIKALPTTNTASGSVAAFKTDLAENLIECKCDIMCSQASGTPTPDTPLPITTFNACDLVVCGKNLLNNSDRTTTGGSYVINNVNVPMVAGKYVLSFNFSGTSNISSLRIDDENGTAIFTTNKTIIVGRNEYLINLPSKGAFVKLFSNAVGTYTNFQIEKGEMATNYEPYNGQTYNIPFGQTVAKGTLNVTTGKLTITKIAHSFDANESFISLEGGTVFAFDFGASTLVNSQVSLGESISSHFVEITSGFGWGDVTSGKFLVAGNRYFGVNPNMTLTDYRTFLANQVSANTPVVAVCLLINPIIIQLDSKQIQAIIGNNNIYADTGDISVKFLLTIGKAISE